MKTSIQKLMMQSASLTMSALGKSCRQVCSHLLAVLATILPLAACASDSDWEKTVQPQTTNNAHDMKMNITVNGKTLSATLVDNSSTAALVELLQKGAVTIDMHDYGNFEKVGDLPVSLPRNDEQITTCPGDVILYLGRALTIYYDVNSWNFTRLGHIDGITQSELKSLLGTGDVTVTFSLPGASVVSSAQRGAGSNGRPFRLDGTLATADARGVVVCDGKKFLKR